MRTQNNGDERFTPERRLRIVKIEIPNEILFDGGNDFAVIAEGENLSILVNIRLLPVHRTPRPVSHVYQADVVCMCLVSCSRALALVGLPEWIFYVSSGRTIW